MMCPMMIRALEAPGTHGGDIIGLADRQRLGARQAGDRRPGGERDGNDGILDARSESCDEGQRQDEVREGQKHIDDAHQHRIDPAAEITCRGADDEPDRRDDDGRQKRDVESDAGTEKQTAIDVATEFVGAEPMLEGGRQQPRRKVLIVNVMRRQNGRQQCR